MRTRADIVDFLKANVASFAGLDDEVVGALVDGSRIVSFEANEATVRHGEKMAHLAVVLAGRAVVRVLDGASGETIRRVKFADAFALMALPVGDAMIADLVAESDCEVLFIPNALLQAVTGTPAVVPTRRWRA